MNKEDKSKLQLIGEIAEANNKNLELIEEINKLYEVLDKIKENTERTIEIIKQQPTEDDTWILERLNSNIKILEEIE